MQLQGPVRTEWKQALVAAGAELADYIPDYAFLARLSPPAKARVAALPFVRWVGAYLAAYKLPPTLDGTTPHSYRIHLAPWADATTQARLAALAAPPTPPGAPLSLDAARLQVAAGLEGVLWIEPAQPLHTYNDVAGGILGAGASWAAGLSGSRTIINITDTGLDSGSPSAISPDFAGRILQLKSYPVQAVNWGGGCASANVGADDGAADLDSGHGTHVAGSALGSGARSAGQFKGLAWGAGLTFQAVEQYTQWSGACAYGSYALTGLPNDVRTLMSEAYAWGARVQNDSWGGGTPGQYDTQAYAFDDFIRNHPDFTVVVAAGNDGVDANPKDGYVDVGSVTSPATAKNVIAIGASENLRPSGGYAAYTWGYAWSKLYPLPPTAADGISDSQGEVAAFSSRGPAADGRIRPDLVAPGTNIVSVRSSRLAAGKVGWGLYNSYYMYDGGTSMASPLAAGAAALVRDFYLERGLAAPSAALIKATLINTAVDLAGYGNPCCEAGQPIPNPHEGWGRIDVGAATTPGHRQYLDNPGGLSTGGSASYLYHVTAGQPFKVTLAWSDAPGSPLAGQALVNNLDLQVTAPDGTVYWGNHFAGGWSVAGGSPEALNNVENVYLPAPAPGLWQVAVRGQNVPQGPQPFALVADMAGSAPPYISGIDPTSVVAGSLGFTLTVNGGGFVSAVSTVLWDGLEQPTTFVSNSQLQASIAASDVASAHTASVLVANGSAGSPSSNTVLFTVSQPANPAPLLATLTPDSTLAGGPGFTLTLDGSGFVAASVVRWNGTDRATTYVSGNRLTASIPAGDIATPGSANVLVFNPTPGGGISSPAIFNIAPVPNPVPALSSLSPASIVAGSPGFSLTVGGSNFVPGSLVRWNGSDRPTTFVSGSQLTAAIPAADTAAAGDVTITVFNPAPGGGTSGSLTLNISPPPLPAWSFLLYLDGDNNLYPWLAAALRRLEQLAPNPDVTVAVLLDGPGNDDTQRLVVQPGGNYTMGVNKWSLGEQNMGDPQTLINFVDWSRQYYPAQHYYLAIADHGSGIAGIAWDDTNSGDFLSVQELQTALSVATNSGQARIDVLHYDACLMGMFENAYQVREYADYLVASQYFGWSVFAFSDYLPGGQASPAGNAAPAQYAAIIGQVTAQTTPRQLAAKIADTYFAALDGYPRTISAVDLSKASPVKDAVDVLAGELRNNLSALKFYLQNTRMGTQKFDSQDYGRITADDEFLDLYDFARRTGQNIDVASVRAAAQGVMDAIDGGFVVSEHHASGMGGGIFQALDGSHGTSIYFPPRAGGWRYGQYVSHESFSFTVDAQWDDLLVDYFGLMGLPPASGTFPGLPPFLPIPHRVYLPSLNR